MSEVEIADGIDVIRADFPAICAVHGLELPTLNAARAEISEAFAAEYIVALWRSSRWLRWRFSHALSGGADGRFARWLHAHGERRFGLSPLALKKIRGVFRRPPGERVRDIYLQDPELQRLFPLGLVPAGQRQIVGWLTTFGRADQALKGYEIIWFLHDSAETVARGVELSYRVNCEWQERFPNALTAAGWRPFCTTLAVEFPALNRWRAAAECPLSDAAARSEGHWRCF